MGTKHPTCDIKDCMISEPPHYNTGGIYSDYIDYTKFMDRETKHMSVRDSGFAAF